MSVASTVQWRKELRELLPWWAAIVLVMVACWALMHPDALPFDSIYSWAIIRDKDSLLTVGLFAYDAGAVILGALSIGHEYSHHTLTQLLAQPVARARVLRVKLVVLAAMLLLLGLLAVCAWGAERILIGNHIRLVLLGIIPLAGGLFMAPWLTMVGRGPLAGVVLTLGLFSILWVVLVQLPNTFVLSTLAIGSLGAIMTWPTFLRLEATGGSQAEVDFAGWFTWSSDDTQARLGQNRVWLLVKKELRLQQATFAASGLYVAVWSMVVAARLFGLATSRDLLLVATFLNNLIVALLAGAVTSAEERRLGAAEWQTLLPVATWKQWTIKAAVAVGITFVLAAALPSYLATIAAEPGMRDGPEAMTIVMFCVAAIYISSISTTGLRAFLVTGPVVAVALVLGMEVLWPIVRAAHPAVRWLVQALPVVAFPDSMYPRWIQYNVALAAGGLALVLLRFGNLNHRSANLSRGRIAAQFAWILAYVCASWIFITFVSGLILHRFYLR